MLRIALMKENSSTARDDAAFARRARVWFEQLQPVGIETVGLYRGLGADAPMIHIFRSQNSREVDKLVGYWREYDIEVYLGAEWKNARCQGFVVSFSSVRVFSTGAAGSTFAVNGAE
jgi:hypothetical protein